MSEHETTDDNGEDLSACHDDGEHYWSKGFNAVKDEKLSWERHSHISTNFL